MIIRTWHDETSLLVLRPAIAQKYYLSAKLKIRDSPLRRIRYRLLWRFDPNQRAQALISPGISLIDLTPHQTHDFGGQLNSAGIRMV
jgi:hypothetical protein